MNKRNHFKPKKILEESVHLLKKEKFIVPPRLQLFHEAKLREIIAFEGNNKLAIDRILLNHFYSWGGGQFSWVAKIFLVRGDVISYVM